MNTAVVGIGSDIDQDQNIALALELLAGPGQIVSKSRPVKTTPIGVDDPRLFLNQGGQGCYYAVLRRL